ncbi:MAG: hypothetical protein KatS3mg028_0134 [Bacteroidia bacterium]|nr:MAG: hypothetical protein KatS3mg028_0134 [Bacteroidia bacterium]
MKEKVWIFIIEKQLPETGLSNLLADCRHFVNHWKSHEMPVQASVEVYKNRLLIFKNDETYNPIGGCATDNLFRFVQELEKKYNTSLTNRKWVVYEKDNELKLADFRQIDTLVKNGEITGDTIIYNTAIISSDEWAEFRKPCKNSWLRIIHQD